MTSSTVLFCCCCCSFCHGDPESIKQILEQYNEDRKIAGFALVEDHAFVPYTATSNDADAYESLQNDRNPAHQSSVNVGMF